MNPSIVTPARHSRLRRAASAMLVLATAALVAACSTPAPTRFHSLLMPPTSVDTPPADPQATQDAGPLLYEFTPISIPSQVDQPQFVVRNPDDTLYVLEQERWIAPLADELHSSLSERLGRRFKAQEARQQFVGQRASQRLQIDVLRFESLPGREVRIEASWSVRTLAETTIGVSCRSEIRQSVGPGYEAIAAGHRAALILLADEIGPVMQGLAKGQTTCR
ncbi:PqiC family protein [soil metagenome]